MISIILLCQYGASTGLIGERIQAAAKKKNIDCIVEAYSISDISSVIDKADVILIGPQMRFKYKQLEEEYKEKNVPFVLIDPILYGQMNGEAILELALNKLSN